MGVIDVGEFIPGEPEHLVTHGQRGPPWRRPPLVAVPQALDALRAKLPEHADTVLTDRPSAVAPTSTVSRRVSTRRRISMRCVSFMVSTNFSFGSMDRDATDKITRPLD